MKCFEARSEFPNTKLRARHILGPSHFQGNLLRLRQAKNAKAPTIRPRQQTTRIKGQSNWLRHATLAPKNSAHQNTSL